MYKQDLICPIYFDKGNFIQDIDYNGLISSPYWNLCNGNINRANRISHLNKCNKDSHALYDNFSRDNIIKDFIISNIIELIVNIKHYIIENEIIKYINSDYKFEQNIDDISVLRNLLNQRLATYNFSSFESQELMTLNLEVFIEDIFSFIISNLNDFILYNSNIDILFDILYKRCFENREENHNNFSTHKRFLFVSSTMREIIEECYIPIINSALVKIAQSIFYMVYFNSDEKFSFSNYSEYFTNNPLYKDLGLRISKEEYKNE